MMTEQQQQHQHHHQRQQQGAIAVVGAAAASTTMATAPSSTSTPQHHQQQALSAPVVETPSAAATQILQPRFEDLTIDDDLPLLPRLQRYIQSSIALQRLVHVRMLGEVALELGQQLTATELVPLLPPLVKDGESIIRQRLCNEIKILCLVLMGLTKMKESPIAVQAPHHEHLSRKGGDQPPPPPPKSSLPQIPNPTKSSKYYKVMVHHLFPHLYTLISDPDNEVRRAASENIVKLALRIDKDDVVPLALSIPLRLVKEGQARASAALSTPGTSAGGGAGGAGGDSAVAAANGPNNNKTNNTPTTTGTNAINPRTTAEELLITASNLLADLSSFLPPPRLPPEVTTRYLSPTILTLADDPNFRVRRAAVQALPRMLGSASLDDVKRRLLPKFVALSADEMYRVRKASGECLVDVSRALVMLPWRLHFRDVWMEEEKRELHDDATMVKMKGSSGGGNGEEELEQPTKPVRKFYKLRTEAQIHELLLTIHECHEIRRRTLCVIAKRLLEDSNKFIRYGMMQFLGPLIASFYPLDRGSMIGSMGGMLYNIHHIVENKGSSSNKNVSMGTLGIGVESVDIAKDSTGLERASVPGRAYYSTAGGGGGCGGEFNTIDNFLSYNHSLHGLELILHGESALSHAVLEYGGGCNANKDPFGTMGPQFFPHANGMVGRSSALDDDDTDSFLLKACMKAYNQKQGVVAVGQQQNVETNGTSSQFVQPLLSSSSSSSSTTPYQSPRSLLPKFLLESRSDALALSRIVWHRTGRVPTERSSSTTLPYPALMSGRPDPDDLKVIANTLLNPYIAMASCHTGEESTDAEMRVYCAYSFPAVVLLFGGSDWEKDGLKRCYLDLLGMKNGSEEEHPSTGNSADATTLNANKALGPPLPVKRCLASSVHAVAHMLGPEIVSKDTAFLTAFEKSFLRDPDEAIRLNILKNLASFLGALPAGGDGAGHRDAYLPMLHSIIMGDDVLGATKRRSASNPGVLNWRQRDAVAKVLPDVIVLFDAHLSHEYLWPILKTLLTDTVSAVRENAGWSVPVLLRKYMSNQENCSEWIFEVTSWLRETFLDVGSKGSLSVKKSSRGSSSARRLKKQTTSSEGAFSRRQGYCRILSTVALAMRMGEGEDGEGDRVNLANSSQYANGQGLPSIPIDPFDKMPQLERDQFRLVMLRDLLPPALEMALDCVANVRLTLTKCLKLLPADLRKESHVEEVLSTLEEELMTWDVGDMMPNQGEYQFDQP